MAILFCCSISTDPAILMHLLSTSPKQTIKLHIFKNERKAGVKCDHRLNRVMMMNRLPLSVWAHWVVQSIPIKTKNLSSYLAIAYAHSLKLCKPMFMFTYTNEWLLAASYAILLLVVSNILDSLLCR